MEFSKDNSLIGKRLNYLVFELVKKKIFNVNIKIPTKNRDSSRILEVYNYEFLVEFNNNHRISKIILINKKVKNNSLDFSDNIWSIGKSKKIVEFIMSFVGNHPDYSFLLKNL